jgi:uncharacterized protein (TIGR02145 family)
MNKFVLFLVLVGSLSLFAQEPIVKFYLNDGSSKQFKISDIDSFNYVKSNKCLSMSIYQKEDLLLTDIDTKKIEIIKFDDTNKMNIITLDGNFSINIPSIDSILLINYTCNEIQIGSQVWMNSNLDIDHYRNGDIIPKEDSPQQWDGKGSGAYCYYDNNPAFEYIGGKLYNWYAVNDQRGLAPKGWHIPSENEWTTLTNYLGGSDIAGGKMKSTVFWKSPNIGATNESGFSAQPGGYRTGIGAYVFGLEGAFWWTSTESETYNTYSWYRNLLNTNSSISAFYLNKNAGLSVRCIRDMGSIPPRISSIKPYAGKIGTIVTITGAGFDTNKKSNHFLINNQSTEPIFFLRWSDTLIMYKVPPGTLSGKVYLWVNDTKSNEVNFIVDSNTSNKFNPKIESLTPSAASEGTIITIAGSGFGTMQNTSFVILNTQILQSSDYLSWNDIEIKIKVPFGITKEEVFVIVKVSVVVNSSQSNLVDFTVTHPNTQVWSLKNLDVDHYRNGDQIPQITDRTEWTKLTTGAWCYYDNDFNNGATYGKLYNWYAVNDARGLAPTGWHIPSDDEWTVLKTYLGGEGLAGGKLKEIGIYHWWAPNNGATDEIGFTALPGGWRDDFIYGTSFNNIGQYGIWWSSTEKDTTSAWGIVLSNESAYMVRSETRKNLGYSVRCVKD